MTADNYVVHNSNANDVRVTHDLNSFGELTNIDNLLQIKFVKKFAESK
jgi:hypothetical protein